jgi:hypothetical protein
LRLANQGSREVRLALGELLPGDPTDEPSVACEFVVHLLEQRGTRPLRAPAAVEGSTIHAGHEADDLRFHGEPSDIKYCTARANTLQTSVQCLLDDVASSYLLNT